MFTFIRLQFTFEPNKYLSVDRIPAYSKNVLSLVCFLQYYTWHIHQQKKLNPEAIDEMRASERPNECENQQE